MSDSENEETMDLEESEDSSSSSTSDSEDDDAENKNLTLYLAALEEIAQNHFNYDSYIQLINAAFKLSDLEKVRSAYKLFGDAFPIAPNLWLKLLKIEACFATSPEEIAAVDLLFKKALGDYFCAEVALEYAKFAAKLVDPAQVWAEILPAYTLDYNHGSLIFDAWREKEAKETPEKVFEMFEREIETPLFGLDEAFVAMKAFYEENKEKITVDWAKMEEKYQKTRKIVQKIAPFEKQLKETDKSFHQERAKIFKEYIRTCQKVLDDKVLIVLHERMVTDCCLDATVWLDYIAFKQSLDSEEKMESCSVFNRTNLDLVNRALRNCTWAHALYVEKIRILEQRNAGADEAQKVIEEVFSVGFQTPEPIVSIWLEYLTSLVRKADFSKESDKDNIRKNFQFCWDTLGRDWDALADVECKILQFWGKLEYGPLGDSNKGRELWHTVMSSADNATKSSLWIEFACLEHRKGKEYVRKVYKKGIASPQLNDPESLAASWIQFERCYGTLEQLKACQSFVLPILANYQYKRAQQGNKRAPKEVKTVKRKAESSDEVKKPAVATPKKVKVEAKVEELEPPLEQMQIDHKSAPPTPQIDSSKDDRRIFISNLNYDITEQAIRAALPELDIKEIDLVKNREGKTRGFGYLELASEVEVQQALTFDRRPINGRPAYISRVIRDKPSRGGKFKFATGVVEPNKLFVKGLNPDTTKEDLERLFAPFGALKEVRVVVHKSGKSKGLAYVEFDDASHAAGAILKTDQIELQGHTISVAISAPPPRGQPIAEAKPESSSRSLGSAKRAHSLAEAKPRLSFIPASVQKKVLQEKASSAPKSNEDFRKMLLKQ